jgi:protein involved in polysaccharide export with SLBB domain
MRGVRILLAVGAVLALSGCVREQYAQEVGPSAAEPAPSSRYLYSSSPAYAQQAYEQPPHRSAGSRTTRGDGRGLINSNASVSVASASVANASVTAAPPPAIGGPYVEATEAYASAPATTVTPLAADPPYTLDAGDKLRVVVFGQDGISNNYVVDAGGKVNLPLIGAINARGLTNQQLAAAIAAQLKQGYVREPHVSVEVDTYRPFFILGEVTTPGQYPYVANLTAETAVAIAGGFAPRASKTTVELTRKTGGQQIRTEVPLEYPVRPGDTILVKERWF